LVVNLRRGVFARAQNKRDARARSVGTALDQQRHLNYPMTLAKRVGVAYPVSAPKWHHPVKVTATEEEHLNSCLSERLNHSLCVPSSPESCYSLVGGRLLPGEVRLAAPVYVRKSDRRTAHALRNWHSRGETTFRLFRAGNRHTFSRANSRVSYALSGRISEGKLPSIAIEVWPAWRPGGVLTLV
jgi:anti-sigma factor RsiW